MKEFIVTTIKFDTTSNDRVEFDKLTDNAKKVYTALAQLTEISPRNTWKLDLPDFCNRNKITEENFLAAVKEICNNNCFMYCKEAENRYVFGTSRLVF